MAQTVTDCLGRVKAINRGPNDNRAARSEHLCQLVGERSFACTVHPIYGDTQDAALLPSADYGS